MIEIIDNFFSEEINKEITRQLMSNVSLEKQFKFINKSLHDCIHSTEFQEVAISFANNFFALESMIGYEMWCNISRTPHNWHTDNDERSFIDKNIINYPLCTIIYYPFVDIESGGRLFFRNDINDRKINSINPVTNRLVIFSSGVPHMVEHYVGNRLSLVINPWHYQVESRS